MATIRLALALALALALTSQAFGQFGGTSRRGGAGSGENRSRQDDGGQRQSEVTRMSANDQIRLQLTNARVGLKLSPEQSVSWQVYEKKVVELLGDSTHGARTTSGVNVVKQIDETVGILRIRLAAFEDLADATKKLYAMLSDEQKGIADRMLSATVPAPYPGTLAPRRS
jgi:hypothetical protein